MKKSNIMRILSAALVFVMVLGLFTFLTPEGILLTASALSYDATGSTSFDEGDMIRIINKTRADKGKSKSDALYNFNGMTWTAFDNSNYIVWDGTDENIFHGVYPCYAEYNKFTIPTDQSSDALLTAADWMTDDYVGVKDSGNGVILNFEHRLAKVTVNITAWNTEFDGADKTITEPKIYTKGTDIGISYGTDGAGIYTSDEALTGIAPSETGHTYTAIVAPAAYAANETFMTLTVDGQALTVLAKAQQLIDGLQPGKHYTFNLTVGKEAVTINSISVSGWNQANIDGGVAAECLHEAIAADGTCTGCGKVIPVTVSTEEELNAAITDGAYIILRDSADIETISIPENVTLTLDLNGKSIPKMTIADGANVTLTNSQTSHWSKVDEIEIGAASVTMEGYTHPESKVVLNSKAAKLDFSPGGYSRIEIVVRADGCSTSQFTLAAYSNIHTNLEMTSVVAGDQMTNGTSYYVGPTWILEPLG